MYHATRPSWRLLLLACVAATGHLVAADQTQNVVGTALWIVGVVVGSLMVICCLVRVICKRGVICGADNSAVGLDPYNDSDAKYHESHPIQGAPGFLDLEEPVTFTAHMDNAYPTRGSCNVDGNTILFSGDSEFLTEEQAAIRSEDKHALTANVLAQASRPLSLPNPERLDPLKPVYFEVKLAQIGYTIPQSEEETPEPSEIRVGWGTRPQHPLRALGTSNHSLCMSSTGIVYSSHVAERVLLVPDGCMLGDVIGCGYELIKERNVVVFFFTRNGQRLSPLPESIATFRLPALINAHKERQGPRAGYSLLGLGCAYPTISCNGGAMLQTIFSSPFSWAPYMIMFSPPVGIIGNVSPAITLPPAEGDNRGERSRRQSVGAVAGAPIQVSPGQKPRRTSTTTPARPRRPSMKPAKGRRNSTPG